MKELRLRGISDREHGNAYLPEFMADYNHRFAREPLNRHDAHRPLLAHEDLSRVFTWQGERRLTDNLTLHYKRVMYIVEQSPAAETARGKRVDVVESEDGTVRLEYRGQELPARAFAKDARFSQAAVVENKLLSGALLAIQAKQREREEGVLQRRKLTLREEDLFRKSLGKERLEHRRSRESKTVVPPHPLLGRALAWAEDFAAAEAANPRRKLRRRAADQGTARTGKLSQHARGWSFIAPCGRGCRRRARPVRARCSAGRPRGRRRRRLTRCRGRSRAQSAPPR